MFTGYGYVQEGRQADIFKQFKKPKRGEGVLSAEMTELAKALAVEMSRQKTD